MQSLKYTNFLLTVIAVCLVYQCVKFGAVPITAATAKVNTPASPSAPAKVEIVGTPAVKVEGTVETNATVKGLADVNIAAINYMRYSDKASDSTKGTIPVTVFNTVATKSAANPSKGDVMKVEITNREVPVEIKQVSSSINSPLPVEIDEIDSTFMNELPVEIKKVGFGITGEIPVRVRK